MGGIGCLDASFPFADFQTITFDDVIETVITHAVGTKPALVHLPKLVPAYTRIFPSDFLDKLHNERFFRQTLQYLVLMLIVGLFTHTKQTAQGNDLIAFPVPFMQPTGYLVPAFLTLCHTLPRHRRPSLGRNRRANALRPMLSSVTTTLRGASCSLPASRLFLAFS